MPVLAWRDGAAFAPPGRPTSTPRVSSGYRSHDVEGEQVGDEAVDVADGGATDPDRVAAVAPAAMERDQVRAGGVVGQLTGLFVSEGEFPRPAGQGGGGRGVEEAAGARVDAEAEEAAVRQRPRVFARAQRHLPAVDGAVADPDLDGGHCRTRAAQPPEPG